MSQKPRNKHRKLIILFSSLVFVMGVFIGMNAYLSAIVLSGPLNVVIEGSLAEHDYAVNGLSPFGKEQILKKKAPQSWSYNAQSNFKSLYVLYADSLKTPLKITVSTHYSEIELTDLKYDNTISGIDLTPQLQNKVSKKEIIMLMGQWKAVQFVLSALFAIILTFLCGFLIFAKASIKKLKIKHALILLTISAFLIHIAYYIIYAQIIFTTGLLSLIVFFLLIYYFVFKVVLRHSNNKHIRNIKIAFISTALSLCLIEIVVLATGIADNFFEKRFGWLIYKSYYTPDTNFNYTGYSDNHFLRNQEFSYYRTVNAEGLSDKEHSIAKKENEYRIIGLGDSFTEGDGTHADSTWLKFLEYNLKEYPLKKELTFMNAGICGSDPFYAYVLLKEKLLKYTPDLVILTINYSDFDDVIIRGGCERFRNDGTIKYNKAPWWDAIYGAYKTSRLFFKALGYNELLYKENSQQFNDTKNKIINVLGAYNTLAKENNFRLILVFHPNIWEINNNTVKLSELIDEISKTNEFEILNLFGYFTQVEGINNTNSSNYYWVQDAHHNARGYKAFGDGVTWFLKKKGIIDFLNSD